MLSMKIMSATDAACQSVCMGEEAAAHYGYTDTNVDRWQDWWRGFFAAWANDRGHLQERLISRVARFFRRKLQGTQRRNKR